MKRLGMVIALAASMAVATPVLAHTDTEAKRSDSIFIGSYGRIHNWRAVGRDELIVWATPSRAYLVKIWRPASSLRFTNTIGITSTVGRITKFDEVIVDRQRLPIKSITAIDRDEVQSLTGDATIR